MFVFFVWFNIVFPRIPITLQNAQIVLQEKNYAKQSC